MFSALVPRQGGPRWVSVVVQYCTLVSVCTPCFVFFVFCVRPYSQVNVCLVQSSDSICSVRIVFFSPAPIPFYFRANECDFIKIDGA